MADIQDTDLFLVNRNNSTGTIPASDLMAEILDDDLMLVNRAGVTHKVTGLEVKDSLGPKDEPPSMTGATLAGTGASFSGQTYTTTLQNYNPGVPEADKTMLAKVTGALSVAGETSAITGVNSVVAPFNFGDGRIEKDITGFCSLNGITGIKGFKLQTDAAFTIGFYKLTVGTLSNDGIVGWSIASTTGTPYSGYSWDLLSTNGIAQYSDTSTVLFAGSGIDISSALTVKLDLTDYGNDGARANDNVFIIDQNGREVPMYGTSTVLTLTDRKDLDNGLFQPGDVVDGYGGLTYDVVSTPTNASNYISNPQNIFDGSDSSYGAWYVDTQGGTLNITFSEQVVASSIRIKTYLTGADFTVNLNGIGLPIDLTSSSETWNDITSGFTGPLTSLLVTMTSTGTGQNWFYAIEVDGTILTAEEVTVVSIDPTSPEMNVSGGTWSVGQTVKNTVARAPEITPTTDEITGFSFTSYSSLPTTGSSYGDAYPWSLAFRSVVDQDGAVGSTDATHYTQSFANIPATTVGLIVDNNLAWVGVAVNGVDLDISNAPISGSYAGNDLDAGFTTAIVREYALPAGNTLDSIGVKTNGPRICGVIVDGTRLTDGQPALTLASDKDLAQFSANDDVTQDSGYTPVTSAITNVATDSVSKVKAYYSSDLPTNLTDAISGTEYDLTKANTNVVENSHYLTLVCEPGCPTSGQVFKTDGGPIFDMKWSNGCGNFDKDGNKLGAADQPPSGPSDTTQILFNDGETTGYIVNIQAAYTVIKTTNLGTVPVVSDAAQGEESVLTLTDDKDLANFRVGDTVLIPDDGTQTAEVKFVVTDPYQVDTVQYYIRSGYSDDLGGGGPPGDYVDVIKVTEAGDLMLNATAYENLGGVTVELINGDPNGEGLIFSGDSATRICPSTVTFGAGGGEMRIKWNKPTTTSHVIYYLWYSGKNNSTWKGNILGNGATYEVEPAKQGTVTAIGPGNTLTLDTPGLNIGDTVTGPDTTPATGTVASTDPAAKTMTLSASDESNGKRWIVNAGKTVVGPTGPATRFDAFLTWSGKQVTGLSTADPGYAQAPPDLQLQFTDPAPSGQTWDQELPAGTTIQTRVKATNASGEADSGWTNVVTPRFLRPGDALPETFAETSLRMATFENRAAVHQGEQAMEKREALAKELEGKGINANELLGVKAKRGRRKPAS